MVFYVCRGQLLKDRRERRMSEKPTILDQIQEDLKGLKEADFIRPPEYPNIAARARSHGTMNDTARRLYTLGRQYGARVIDLQKECSTAALGLGYCDKCPVRKHADEISELIGRQGVISDLLSLELMRQFPEAREVAVSGWNVLEDPPATRQTMVMGGIVSFLDGTLVHRH